MKDVNGTFYFLSSPSVQESKNLNCSINPSGSVYINSNYIFNLIVIKLLPKSTLGSDFN